jgi:hypothetical protein
MSDSDNLPPPIPGARPVSLAASLGSPASAPAPTRGPRLGEDPNDRLTVSGLAGTIEAMLRHPRRVMFSLHSAPPGALIAALIGLALFCSLIYGVVVGSFSGDTQYWAAPVKIAGGLFISALICLPSLYIFSCLSGSEARLVEVLGLVMGLLALMTILLIGFAPVAWVFSQSTASLAAMGALHLVFWAIATYFGLRFLHAGLRHLGGKPAGLRVWVIVFVLVMLQMTTALRPIVGRSDQFVTNEKKFFVKHWMEQLSDNPTNPPATRRF